MQQLTRKLEQIIIQRLKISDKAVIVYGARQVGKTTLADNVIDKLGLRALRINADETDYLEVLSSLNKRRLADLVEGYELLFIDEAQRVANIGLCLKILVDNFQGLKMLITGSSSFELASNASEPLTGRKWTFQLFPFSQSELAAEYSPFELDRLLEERLIWGSYPEILSLRGTAIKKDYLRELSGDYLVKDILKLKSLKNPDRLKQLLKLISFQIGSEVSYAELGAQLGMSTDTVMSYLDILEKMFVIMKVTGFSRNLRREVTKSPKFYFCDLGFRNALINNFNSTTNRVDVVALWENFLLIERVKKLAHENKYINPYFWRLYTGAEIDYIEEDEAGVLRAYEFKWGNKKRTAPKTWLEQYPSATWKLINKENWQDFVTNR